MEVCMILCRQFNAKFDGEKMMLNRVKAQIRKGCCEQE